MVAVAGEGSAEVVGSVLDLPQRNWGTVSRSALSMTTKTIPVRTQHFDAMSKGVRVTSAG